MGNNLIQSWVKTKKDLKTSLILFSEIEYYIGISKKREVTLIVSQINIILGDITIISDQALGLTCLCLKG